MSKGCDAVQSCTNDELMEFMSDEKSQLSEHMDLYFTMRDTLCIDSDECMRTFASIIYRNMK